MSQQCFSHFTCAYPITEALVGKDAFAGLARAYVLAHPSRASDPDGVGHGFASFLQGIEHADSPAYLPDLARLEWRVHRAHVALGSGVLDLAALSRISPERTGEIGFRWAPGTALVASAFPIVRIWGSHRRGLAGEFELEGTAGEIACVARQGSDVSVSAIDAGDAAFLEASLAGATFGLAFELAIAADSGFDPARLLRRAIGSGMLSGFVLHDADRT